MDKKNELGKDNSVKGLTPEQEIMQKAHALKIKQKKEAMTQINTILKKYGLKIRVEHQIVIEERK